MAVFNDGHDNQEDYKADLSWEYRKGGPNDPETYEPVEDDQLDEWTDLEFMEALAEEYRETGRPWSAIRIERITKKLKELDEPRGCYPVNITAPEQHHRTTAGYYDPSRNLLFTRYLTGELAKQLGIKWQREEEQHGPQ